MRWWLRLAGLARDSPRRATYFLGQAKKATRLPAVIRFANDSPTLLPVRRPAQNSPCGLEQLRRKAPPPVHAQRLRRAPEEPPALAGWNVELTRFGVGRVSAAPGR